MTTSALLSGRQPRLTTLSSPDAEKAFLNRADSEFLRTALAAQKIISKNIHGLVGWEYCATGYC